MALAMFTAHCRFVASLLLLSALCAARPASGAAFDVDGSWPLFRRGSANAAAVHGKYAYVTGPRFQVVDISNPGSPQRVGGLDNPVGEGYGITIADNYAYVANGGSGLTVIDISTPALPQVVTNHPGVYANFVAVQGGYAYVANEYRSLKIFDISNPANLRLIAVYPTAQPAVGVNVAGRYAYVAVFQSPVEIVDVSNPAEPRRVASVKVAGEPWRVELSGNYAYVTGFNTGLEVIDISNPAAPRRTGGVSFSGWSRGVMAAGDRVHVVTLPFDGGESFRTFDVSDPTRPRQLGGARTSGAAVGLALAGPYAYAAGEVGLDVIDISDAANPQRTGSVDLNGDGQNLAASGQHVYLADGVAGLQIIDISDAGKPQRVGRYVTAGPATGVAISNLFAYVTLGASGLDIVDISDSAHPRLTGHWQQTGGNYASAVTLLGKYACVVDGDLQLVDISDPTKPTGVSTYPAGRSAYHLAVSGSYVFLAKADLGWEAIDVSNPARPTMVSAQTNGVISSMVIHGEYLYVADSEGLKIWNVSSPARPVIVGGYKATGWPSRLAVHGNYVFLTESQEFWHDVLLLDVSDPTQPRFLLRFGEGGWRGDSVSPAAMMVHNGLLLAAQGELGLSIRRVPGPLAILKAPHDQRVTPGESAELNVAAFGDSGVQFAWYAGPSGVTSQPVAAATGPTLTVPSIWEPASFWVRITNAAGALDSQSVTVRPAPALQAIQRGTWRAVPPGFAYDVALSGNYACLADGLALEVLDVSDPARPSGVGRLPIAGGVYHVSMDLNHAYVLTGDRGLRVIDIRDPAKPVVVGSYSNGAVFERIAVAGSRAYLAAGNEGVLALDVSNPAAPKLLGKHTTDGHAQDVALRGQHVFAVLDRKLCVIDFSDPANPKQVGSFPESANILCGGVDRVLVSGNHALVSSSDCRFFPAIARLDLLDISQPDHPRLVGSLETEGSLAAVGGIYAFLISNGNSVEVLDIAEPSTPVRVGSFAGVSGPTGLAASGTHVFLADGINGLRSFELVPKLLVAPPLLSADSLTLRWTGGAGTTLQQAFTLDNPSWKDLDNTDGQSRIQVRRTEPFRFFRAIQR